MVKKVKKTAGSPPPAPPTPSGPGLLDSQFGQLVKESAQQIWSAGLAAFAKAQNNSGKAFDNLAAEGAKLQKKTQASAEERLGAVATRMSDMAGEVGTRAGQHWDKLESIFEDRVARALHRLGAPSAKDFEALNARLDALTAALQAQQGEQAQNAGTGAGAATSAKARAKASGASSAAPVAAPSAAAKASKAAKPSKTAKAVDPSKAAKPSKATTASTATRTAAAASPGPKTKPGSRAAAAKTRGAAKASKAAQSPATSTRKVR